MAIYQSIQYNHKDCEGIRHSHLSEEGSAERDMMCEQLGVRGGRKELHGVADHQAYARRHSYNEGGWWGENCIPTFT